MLELIAAFVLKVILFPSLSFLRKAWLRDPSETILSKDYILSVLLYRAFLGRVYDAFFLLGSTDCIISNSPDVMKYKPSTLVTPS